MQATLPGTLPLWLSVTVLMLIPTLGGLIVVVLAWAGWKIWKAK